VHVWYRPIVQSNNASGSPDVDVTERISLYIKPFIPAIIKEDYTKSQQPQAPVSPQPANNNNSPAPTKKDEKPATSNGNDDGMRAHGW
jgi:hypothetical protein